jgi:hypothetical protein
MNWYFIIIGAVMAISKPEKFQVQYTCETKSDDLTKRVVYTKADVEPENEGGKAAIGRAFNKTFKLDTIPDDYDTRFVVAFIVEKNGKISGERIIHDKTNSAGKRLIEIAKSFKWSPAVCNGQKVDFLHQFQIQVCLTEE